MPKSTIAPCRRRIRLAALISASAIAVSACGLGGATTDDANDDADLTSFTVPATAYDSAIGYYSTAVAQELGYFEDEGLDPEFIPVGGGGESVRAFTSDRNALVGSVGFLAAIPAIDQGEDLAIFAQLSRTQDTYVAVNADGDIKSPSDLRGERSASHGQDPPSNWWR